MSGEADANHNLTVEIASVLGLGDFLIVKAQRTWQHVKDDNFQEFPVAEHH
jgi:hypothetical protein